MSQTEVKEDSAAATVVNPISGSIVTSKKKIEEWLKASGIKIIKHNIQPWGSFTPALSWNGNAYLVLPQFFGSGFSETESTAIFLEKIVKSHEIDKQLVEFLSSERIIELKALANV